MRTDAGTGSVDKPGVPLEWAHRKASQGVLKVALGLLLEHLDERLADLGFKRPGDGRHLDGTEGRERVDDGALVCAEALRRGKRELVRPQLTIGSGRNGRTLVALRSRSASNEALYVGGGGSGWPMFMPSSGETTEPR